MVLYLGPDLRPVSRAGHPRSRDGTAGPRLTLIKTQVSAHHRDGGVTLQSGGGRKEIQV